MLAGDGFFGQSGSAKNSSTTKDNKGTNPFKNVPGFVKNFFEDYYGPNSGVKKFLPFPMNLNYGITEQMFPETVGNLENIFKQRKEEKTKVPERDYLDENKQLLKEIAGLGEQARNRDFMREGIRTLANAPLIGAQAQLAAAEGINRLTIGNMGAMAAQNRVLEANPPKQKIAGRYFRG
tara:strand:- start:3479 stop:4015 length:537 start_codon:yes stop_codon:yes gene_type:complete